MSGREEKLRLIIAALDYSIRHIVQTKNSLSNSLSAGGITAPLTLLDQFERDLDSLAGEVSGLEAKCERALAGPGDGIDQLQLDGAAKDILLMSLGMYELDLRRQAGSPAALTAEYDANRTDALRLIEDIRKTLDLESFEIG